MAELVSYSCKEQKITKQRRGFSLFHFDSALRRFGGGRDMLLLMEDDLGSWFLWGPDTSPAPSSLSCVRSCHLLCLLISELVHCGEMWQNTQSPDPECYCHRPDQISKELDSVSTSPSFPFCNIQLHFPLLSQSQPVSAAQSSNSLVCWNNKPEVEVITKELEKPIQIKYKSLLFNIRERRIK